MQRIENVRNLHSPFTVLRWGDAAEEVLYELYDSPEVQDIVALQPGRKRRQQGAFRRASRIILRGFLARAGMERGDRERAPEYQDRLWTRANAPDTTLLPALPDETEEEYHERYKGLSDVRLRRSPCQQY